MRITFFLFFGCLMLSPVAWGQANNTTSQSTATIATYNTTSVTQQVNTYQTELKARMQGGAYLFDQTYNVAFNDPSIATAITQAKNVLAGAGAVTFSGPTLLSSNQSASSATNTVQTGQTGPTVSVSVTAYIGPQTLTLGNFGTCTGYTLTGPQAITPTGCTGGSTIIFNVVPGGQDINTFILAQETISQTATTTNTTLTSQVYELDGFPVNVTPTAVTPAPPTLLLCVVGMGIAGLYAARLRLRNS